MKKSDNREPTHKNILSGNEINAGKNVHIGDIYYNSPKKSWLSKNSTTLLSFLAIGIISSGIVFFIFYKNPRQNEAAKAQEKGDRYPDTVSHFSNTPVYLKTRGAMNNTKESANAEVIREEGVNIPPPNKPFDLKAFLKGETVLVPGNGQTTAFRMNKYEVTVGQYFAFCQVTNRFFPHEQVDTAQRDLPMHSVSWHDANAYCEYAGGRLPSKDEWIQAALLSTGNDSLPDNAEKNRISWNRGNSNGRLHPVGSSGRGSSVELFDLFGNVEEWCADGPVEGLRFTAGGSYRTPPEYLNIQYDGHPVRKNSTNKVVGFRTVFD